MMKFAVFAILFGVVACRPQLPADVDISVFTPAQQAVIRAHDDLARAAAAKALPDVPGLAEHQAAEAQVLALQGINPGLLSHAEAEARVFQQEASLLAAGGF